MKINGECRCCGNLYVILALENVFELLLYAVMLGCNLMLNVSLLVI